MPMVLLDTEPMTVLEREGPEAEVLIARLARIPLDDLATTIISYEEQTRGWLAYIAQIQTEETRVRAYRFLNRHLDIYCRIAVVQYDERGNSSDFLKTGRSTGLCLFFESANVPFPAF